MNELNKEQQEAANFLYGCLLVCAVPGSGKTRTMTERIGILVKKHGIAPENILGLTFTRNAAQVMRERLVPVLNGQALRVTLSTIHSFCHYLLKREGKTFEILSGKDQIIFIKKIINQLKIKDMSTGTILSEISLAKNNLISVSEFRDLYQGDKAMLRVADVYETYDQEKSKKMLLDLDDLLVETCQLLNTHEKVRDKYRHIFQHILVDEFQDTNPVQMEIIKLLINENNDSSSFFVCGDDWQSIYAFTGASIGNILNFKDTFPGSKEVILNLNYRSTPQIIKGCQNLIQHNTRKIDKTLRTQNENGDNIIVLESSSEEGEALNLVTEINDLVGRKGYVHKDIAVLYRANFQSRTIEEAFCQYKIPYHIENGQNFYNRREIKILLDYLRLISSPDSVMGDDALLSIINVPNRFIGKKFTQELDTFALKNDIHLYQALKAMSIDVPYLKKNIRELAEFLDELIVQAQILEPSELIQIIREGLDYDRYISDDDIVSPDDLKIQNINQLRLAATRFKDVKSFLDYTETFQNEASNTDKDGVALMTIHKSKGLEFPAVFVIGVVEGIMPTKRGDVEEERRICFVGISRAMKILYLSHSLSFLGQPVKKSIFIDEIMGIKK